MLCSSTIWKNKDKPSRLFGNELDDQFQERVHVMIDAIGRKVIKVIYLSPNDPSLLEEKKKGHITYYCDFI